MWWKKAPFIRILPPFGLGIFISDQWDPSILHLSLISTLAFLLFLSERLLKDHLRYRFSWVPGLAFPLIFLVAGALICRQRDPEKDRNWYGNLPQPKQEYMIRILETPIEKKNSFQTKASLLFYREQGYLKPVSGRVLVYFKKQGSIPSAGSLLFVRLVITPIKNKGNPGEFDLKSWLRRQGISGSIFLEEKDILSRKEGTLSQLERLLQHGQLAIRNLLKKYIPGKKESGLAEALLIGYRGDLDKELSQAYSNTGTVHIIAISGMHLSLIYTLLLWLFRPLSEKYWIKWIKVLLLLAVLWLFSLLCGGQPSILRATISFSFLLSAHAFSRRTTTLNALAGAAFLLLCADPFYLWDAGFQLSFAALSGILYFNNRIRSVFQTENRILQYIYDLFSVTISAQLLTFPLSVYHFHQFPLYFLFSNLVAVPLSGCILLAEICLLALSPFPLLPFWIGQAINFLIRMMNGWIEKTSQLPFSSIEGIQIDGSQLILLYFSILGLGLFLARRGVHWLWPGLFSLILFVLISSLRENRMQRTNRLIVYSIKNHSLAEYQSGGKAWAFFPADAESTRVREAAHRVTGVRKIQPIQTQGNYSLAGKTWMIGEEFCVTKDPMPDWLLLHGKAKLIIQEPSLHPAGMIIIDNSVPYLHAKKIERLCDSLHIAFHSIRDQGAFIVEF